jgi:hypothetical protein
VFILTDGKCHDTQVVCEQLERMTQEGSGPTYLVLVGLECDAVGRRNLRDIAQSFGLWTSDPPGLPEKLKSQGKVDPFFIIQKNCPRATQALPPKVASQLKELVWLAERDTRATRSDAQRDAGHLKASQQELHQLLRGPRLSGAEALQQSKLKPPVGAVGDVVDHVADESVRTGATIGTVTMDGVRPVSSRRVQVSPTL